MHAHQQRATHYQKRNYDSKAVARTFPIGCWVLIYYPPARKNKLCSPWNGPYKVVHMDDLKRCAPPDPAPSWPDMACGTSVVLSTRAPSTFAPTLAHQSITEPGGAQRIGSVTSNVDDTRASDITDQSEEIHTDTNTQPKIYRMRPAYYLKTLNVALTLGDFAFTQWKHYFMPCNFSLWVIRNISDSSLDTREWIM